MHPPTPFPASAKSKLSVNKKEPLLERPTRTKGLSKSEQSPLPSIRKGEENSTKKHNDKTATTPNNRYSIASKLSSTKAESQKFRNDTSLMLSKRSSYQGSRPTSISMTVAHTSSDKTSLPIKGVTTMNPHTPILKTSSFQYHRKIDPPYLVKESAMKTLKSSHYWMEQIKLAEEIQKHAVAMTFFRLALECDAEPKDLLKGELVAYTERFSLCCDSTKQVLLCYGISGDIQESQISTNSDASDGITSPCTHMTRVEHSIGAQSNATEATSSRQQKSEENHANKEIIEINGSPVLPGHIAAMDVDALTREVVSCIMSSMDCNNSPTTVERQMCSYVMIASPPVISPSGIKGNANPCQGESKRSMQGLKTLPMDDIINCDLDRAEHSGSMLCMNVSSEFSEEVDTDKKHCNQLLNLNLEKKFISMEEYGSISAMDPNVSTCLSESSLCELNLNDGLETCEMNSALMAESTFNNKKDADTSSSCTDNNLKQSILLKAMDVPLLKDRASNNSTVGEADMIEIKKSGIQSCRAEGDSEGINSLNEVTDSPTIVTGAILTNQSRDLIPLPSKKVGESAQKRGKTTSKQRRKSTASIASSGCLKKMAKELTSPSDKNPNLDAENSNIFIATPESAGLRRSARLKATPAKTTSQLDTNTLSIPTPHRRR